MSVKLAGINFGDSFQRTFDDLGEFLPDLIGAIAIFIIGRFIAKFIYKIVKKGLTKANVRPTLTHLSTAAALALPSNVLVTPTLATSWPSLSIGSSCSSLSS